jgi:hypothetical protein
MGRLGVASEYLVNEVQQRILREWLKRPEAARTAKDVMAFYAELAQSQPVLLDGLSYPGDTYQGLMSVLRYRITRHGSPSRMPDGN